LTGKSIKCHNCNASLDIPEGVNKIFCLYCGTQNLLADILEIPGLTLLCLKCNTKNKDDNTYCDKCGCQLRETCPFCFELHPAGKEFCPKTGRNIKDFQNSIKTWEFQTETGIYSGPSVCDGCVYFGSDKFYCLDTKTGKKIWEFDMEVKSSKSSPCIWKNSVYFGSDKLYCLDAKTGKKQWEFKGKYTISSSPCIVDDLLYIYIKGKDTTGYIYCLSPISGSKIWRFEAFHQWSEISPCVSDRLLYFVRECDYSDFIHKLTCVNAITGRIIWERRVDLSLQIDSRPCVSDNMVYFGCTDGIFYCLDAKTGTKIWEFKQTSGLKSSPSVSNNMVYFGGDKLYCLNGKTGSKIWEFEKGTMNSPCIADGLVYFGSDKFYCLDGKSGNKIWEFNTDGPASSGAYMYDGFIYFGDNSKLYCLDTGKRGITAGNTLVAEPVR
jgi:outer membrane protein assembly factor BamB